MSPRSTSRARSVRPRVNNLNGIAATPDGSTLIVVNSATGKLYAIDTATIATREIDLAARR